MDKFSEYKVPLAGISEGRYGQEFVCNTEFFRAMENDEVLSSEVRVELTIEHKHGSYACHFSFSGEIEVACDRCLEPLAHKVSTEYDVTVKYGYEYDDSQEDLLILPENDRYFDVSGILYDSILLTLPIRNVHKEGECNESMSEILSEHTSNAEEYEETE